MEIIKQNDKILLRNGKVAINANCCCECPPGQKCGPECCKPDETCCDEEVCCTQEQTCCSGSCCDNVCCEEVCCEPGEQCCVGAASSSCCPNERTCCEGVCCEPNESCVDGECVESCPEGQFSCGENCCPDEVGYGCCAGECCPPENNCVDGVCAPIPPPPPCPPERVCGNDCCEPGEACCAGECCDLSGCYWEFDCAADGAVSLLDGLNPTGRAGCIKIVLGSYDAGVNSPSTQSTSSTLSPSGFPWNPSYTFSLCPYGFFTLFRNANCETVFPDGTKGGAEVSEFQYKVYRASCSGAAVDVSDEAVADGFRGVIRFEPQDVGFPPCSTPADPPLLDWLSPPALYCPP